MKVFDLMKKVNVEKIGIRLCKNIEDAKKKSYEGTTIKYQDELDDMPAEYASYQIITSKVKANTLFCWCIKDSLTVKDILKTDGYNVSNCSEYLTFYNYISEYDALNKNHEHSIKIEDLSGIEECEVIDSVIYNDYADIYVFKDNIRSNIFEKSYDSEGLKLREL